MSDPFLSTRNSGYGGRGYVAIFEEGKPTVPSVTTVLGALDKPGLIQWAVDQTAGYAAVNWEKLGDRSVEDAFKFARFYHNRKPDFDDPEVDIHDYHRGVLNDLAELGTMVHSYIEADLNGDFEPELVREEQIQMAEQYLLWRAATDLQVIQTEVTVFGDGYAGTLDAILRIDGTIRLVDHKTSRAVRDEHMAQLAALGACHSMAIEVPEGTEGAVEHTKKVPAVEGEPGAEKKVKRVKGIPFPTWVKDETRWFVAEPLPPIQGYGVLQLRPDDVESDGTFKPAFCEFHEIPNRVIDAAFDLFKGALAVKVAQNRLGSVKKELGRD